MSKPLFVTIFFVSFLVAEAAGAHGWWGRGAHEGKDWLLEHGGTLIAYEIKNTKETALYVARMYLLGATGAGGGDADKAKAGDLIEEEPYRKATFDDAINNKYRIRIFENGEKKMTTDVVARPGEAISLTFDLASGNIKTKTEVVYAKDDIVLTAASAKYIKLSEIDTKKPTFIRSLPETLVIAAADMIDFEAVDERSGVDHYRVQLLDEDGDVLRDWKKQDDSYYFIPEDVVGEAAKIKVRAYDRADNFAEDTAEIRIRPAKNSGEEDELEDANVQDGEGLAPDEISEAGIVPEVSREEIIDSNGPAEVSANDDAETVLDENAGLGGRIAELLSSFFGWMSGLFGK